MARLAPLAIVAACGGQGEDTDSNAVTGDDAEWEAKSAYAETSSTHLWIVDRAIDIASKHPESAGATKAHALLTAQSCRAQWELGLFDADHRHEYNNGRTDLKPGASAVGLALANPTWKSHFFDPDTRQNYKGESDPTAYTEALRHLQRARETLARDQAGACYELGLSLHYVTDLTQPMHAANITALTRPKLMHSNIEEWSMELQNEFVLADWSGPSSLAPDPFVVAVARASKANWGTMFTALADAYEAHPNRVMCGSLRTSAWHVLSAQEIDHPTCWKTAPAVKTAVGKALAFAQNATAQYLAIVGDLI